SATTTPTSPGYRSASSAASGAAAPDRAAAATASTSAVRSASGSRISPLTASRNAVPGSGWRRPSTVDFSAGTPSAANESADAAGSRNPHSASNSSTATRISGLWYGSL